MLVIGTDEAGYGPNLGPLVVSATVWETPTESLDACHAALRAGGFAVGDSKKLFHGGASLAPLETGVLSAFSLLGFTPPGDAELFRHLGAELESGPNLPLPTDATPEQLHAAQTILEQTLAEQGVRLTELRSRVVSAREFNRRLDAADAKGAKATVLSETTLELVADILRSREPNPDEKTLVCCDKHGGRNRYLDLLVAFFPGEFIRILEEGRERSVYRLDFGDRRLEFRFQAKGESELPIALASMLSKYLRELAMRRFNAFWREKLPNLQPTAGYPEDAKRFKRDIAAVQKTLNIEDDALWRRK